MEPVLSLDHFEEAAADGGAEPVAEAPVEGQPPAPADLEGIAIEEGIPVPRQIAASRSASSGNR